MYCVYKGIIKFHLIDGKQKKLTVNTHTHRTCIFITVLKTQDNQLNYGLSLSKLTLSNAVTTRHMWILRRWYVVSPYWDAI